MELLPFYHAYPGSRTLTIKTKGCNFNCRYCTNVYIALEDPDTETEHIYTMTPEELVRMAQKLNCSSIVFNVNKPAVSIPALLKLKETANCAGLPMG
jgi:pyruvate formate lyase activating enzyme